MPVYATWAPEDGLLGAIAPVGLAAAGGTALLVDLDPAGPRYPGAGSLAGLVSGGPRRDDLEPAGSGLAVLRNGGITPTDAREVVTALVRGWPRVVIRLPGGVAPSLTLRAAGVRARILPIRPLVPGPMLDVPGPAVYQSGGWRIRPPGPGLVLPRPRPATWSALASGVVPVPDRWLLAWQRLWRLS
jgi:hypothetical protein